MDWMEQLQIRYVKMHFTLQFIEDADLHTYKNSMFRGGIGEMLLQQHCIRDRICRDKTKTGLCEFEKECVVQQMMYTEPEILPDYMKERCSVGYAVECESKKRHFTAGDTLEFSLILFGKNIAYLSLYMQAVYLLGQMGLGILRRIIPELRKDPLKAGTCQLLHEIITHAIFTTTTLV